jgi:hypothetical protein
LRTKSQPIKWTSNYFGVEKHFSTHACLSYKTEHENRKRSSEVVLQLSKTVFLLGNTCTALQTVNVQELVTVQQMTNVWKLCETGGGTANCLAIIFSRVIFRRNLSWMLGFNKTTVYSFGGGNRQRSTRISWGKSFYCTVYTILITAFVYQTSYVCRCFFWRFVN